MKKFRTLVVGLFAIGSSTLSADDSQRDGWKTDEIGRGNPTVYHQAELFPRLAENNLVFECDRQILKVQVIGFQPLQQFPQPEMEMRVGDKIFSRIATAIYIEASKPSGPLMIPQEKLDDNLKGKDLSWPGHPAYSRFSISMPTSEEFFTAFKKGGPFKLSFAGQYLSFPNLNEKAAQKFVELCKADVSKWNHGITAVKE